MDALVASVDAVLPAGRTGKEAGVFWLGKRGSISTIRTVVVPSGPGVETTPWMWRVSPEVFGTLTRWAIPLQLTLLGVVHTHLKGTPPRLSLADRTESVQVPGILAVVIGNGGMDRDYRTWGWYTYDKVDFREFSRNELLNRVRVLPQAEREVWAVNSSSVWKITGKPSDE